jgi:hypothetical protein
VNGHELGVILAEHRDLKSSLLYARIQDHTVAQEYYQGMAKIEDT